MLIKSADDKSKRITLLEELQKSVLLDRGQRDWLGEELVRTKRGMQGERDAAHYLDNYLKDDPDRAVIHDLRISVDGQVAQIDHLVMTRAMHFYLLETKNFSGSVHINEQGEFSVQYSGERVFGIESPVEQSRRHEGPLLKLFERLGISGRNGAAPALHHCVLVHPKATIHRPKAKGRDTSMVIKADQFRTWHEEFRDRGIGWTEAVGALMNMRSADTLRELAEKLARQHRPANLLALPPFMQPRIPATDDITPSRTEPLLQAVAKKSLVCATCRSKISFPEGKFCWNNEKRFGGLQYCREHQTEL